MNPLPFPSNPIRPPSRSGQCPLLIQIIQLLFLTASFPLSYTLPTHNLLLVTDSASSGHVCGGVVASGIPIL